MTDNPKPYTYEELADSVAYGCRSCARLLATIKALQGRVDLMQKSQTYSYIGKDGKSVLARELEDRLEASERRIAELEKEREWQDMETCPNFDPRRPQRVWVLWPEDARSEDDRVDLRSPDPGFWKYEKEKHGAATPIGWMHCFVPTPPEKEKG